MSDRPFVDRDAATGQPSPQAEFEPLRGSFQPDPSRLAEMRWRFGLGHLICLAAMLHIGASPGFLKWQIGCGLAMLACSTVFFLLELADDSSSWTFRRVLGVLLPCATLPARSGDGRRAYFPGTSSLAQSRWFEIGGKLERSLEASFAGPMIAMALVIVPLLAIEHWWGEAIEARPWATFALAVGHAVIWAAFAFEFIVRINVARSKWAYARKHWLDALIIALPLVAFLRTARLGQLARLQQTTRMFRLKGVVMRAWRGLILFDLLSRILDRECDRKAIRLQNTRSDLLRQLDRIDTELAEIEIRRAA